MSKGYKLLGIISFCMPLLAGCMMDKRSAAEEEQRRMVVVNENRDNMIYATLEEVRGEDSLFINTDEGDSLWIKLASDGAMLGEKEIGCRLAIVPIGKTGRIAEKVINLTLLMGEWVQPSPLAEGTYYGVELQEGGTALSINSQTTEYEGWHLFEGRLLLSSVAAGLDVEEQMIDTFRIVHLSNDSLLLEGTEARFYFCRASCVKARDELRPYMGDDEMGDEYDYFNPEGDVPDAASEEEGLMY